MNSPPPSVIPQNLFVGVAGWNDPSWRALLAGRGSEDVLRFLACAFNLIEITSSYYHPPDLKSVQNWLALTADNPKLRFTVRVWQKLVRERPANSQADIRLFAAGLAPLTSARRLAALIATFSPLFRHAPANLDRIFWLSDTLAGYPLVVELQHYSWQDESAWRNLLERGIFIAHVDQPRPGRAFIFNHEAPSRFAYLRFDGRNQDRWLEAKANRDDRYDYLYSKAELAVIAAKVKILLGQTSACHVVFNNHPNGQALANALQLQSTLTGAAVPAPANLLGRFPFLEEKV